METIVIAFGAVALAAAAAVSPFHLSGESKDERGKAIAGEALSKAFIALLAGWAALAAFDAVRPISGESYKAAVFALFAGSYALHAFWIRKLKKAA